MKYLARLCCALFLILGAGEPVVAENDVLVVIVSAHTDAMELSRSELIHLYMGRINRLPSGVSALPLDLDSARDVFYAGLVNKRLAEINAYWARLVFSGKASPPHRVGTVAEMLDLVANTRGAIGYVYKAEADERVRVVMEIAPPGAEL